MTGHVSCCSAVLIQPAVDAVAPDQAPCSPAPDGHQMGLASKTTTCELLPGAVLTCLCALLGQHDCEIIVWSPIRALNSNSSFQLPADCLSASSVCSNLSQQLFPGADISLFNGEKCKHAAVVVTDLPGGFFGVLATKCSRRRLIEVHLPLSQQGWLHRSQLVPWLSEQKNHQEADPNGGSISRHSSGTCEHWAYKHVHTSRWQQVCLRQESEVIACMGIARILRSQTSPMRHVKQTMQAISGHCSGEKVSEAFKEALPNTKESCTFRVRI